MLDLDFDAPDRVGAAGQNIACLNVVLGNAAVVDHMHLTGGFLDFAGAADAKGTARGNVQTGRARRDQNGIRLRNFCRHARS